MKVIYLTEISASLIYVVLPQIQTGLLHTSFLLPSYPAKKNKVGFTTIIGTHHSSEMKRLFQSFLIIQTEIICIYMYHQNLEA